MDDKVRVIETARWERHTREETAAAVPAAAETAETHGEVAAASSLGFTDTIVFEHPVFDLAEEQRERERILAPDAGGSRGVAYKMLRTQVMRRLQAFKANSIAVLAASRGEGKTLTAINLAIAVAADFGHTALLVDLDLRNPSIHKRFGVAPAVGIDDCLQYGRPVREAMIKIAGYSRLTILPARAPLDHSSELLAAPRTGELVRELRQRYANRIVIFDLPPALLTDDALAFSRHVQAGLLVVAEGKTSREDVRRTLSLLHDLTIVGTTLNGSRERQEPYYY
jgi:Mrp family chromosome partitioning ATPase